MSKDHALNRSANLIGKNHPTLSKKRRLAQYKGFLVNDFFKVYFSVCLEFFQTVTAETMFKKKETVQFL